jgi:hypothetical protein
MTDKELPDCRLCDNYLWCTKPHILDMTCTNGSEFKPAEPIRLYTISEDK